jgi:fibronectin-binding autotransporter adhesin
LGGVISTTGSATTTITTAGGVSPATGLGAFGVNADGAGSQIKLGAATITTSGAGAFGLYASDAAASGTAGSITATGTLNITTTNAAAAAVGMQGNGASILATGGGTIISAGNAISMTGGTNQTATFNNFTINNHSGSLVFADPSVSTINFNNTTANAGANYLLYATGAGTVVTLNANASTLTGGIQTTPGATSNVNLANGTTWNLTGPSTVTNLNVTNSIIVFAPPGSGSGFKTLTVTNYVGSGASITLNAALGGSNSGSDQIIVNGGSATGTTFLTIRNVGGAGGQTSGSGIPIVVTTNGGTIASNAFALASTPVVGGFKYSLDEVNDAWYLVSSPTTTQTQVQSSINSITKAQQSQIITNRVLGSILLGATEQISCSSCGSGFGSIGSLALGAHGRLPLSDQLTAMGGVSYNQWSSGGISVYDAPTVAGSLVYDFSNLGSSRPFVEVGGGLTPYEQVKYSRNYSNGYGTALGTATAVDRDLSLFARVGWLARLTPIDEAAVYGDLSRNWMQTGGYAEAMTAINPFPETVPTGLDTLNVARIGGQFTHLFNGNIEVNVSGGVAYGFGAGSGTFVNVFDFGPIAPNALPNTTWVEYGARLGYRFSDRMVVDAFVLGTAFGEVGSTLHGGIGLRFSF